MSTHAERFIHVVMVAIIMTPYLFLLCTALWHLISDATKDEELNQEKNFQQYRDGFLRLFQHGIHRD